jgi:preprotein translocase subunit SecG
MEKYFDCFWPGSHVENHSSRNPSSRHFPGQYQHIQQLTNRACLERIAFTLLTLVLIIVFLIAALVLVYLGTANLDHLSNVAYTSQRDGRLDRSDGSNSPKGSSGRDDHNFEDGVEIVKIKTTEEKVRIFYFIF